MTDVKGRRLAAILMADMAGYTALVSKDRDATLAAWKTARNEIIDPSVVAYSGKVIKYTGDGFLAEFSSVQNAVSCAVDMQRDLASSPLEFRIGISLGDVVVDGTDIYGHGVNVAARIEPLAELGGICVSGTVFEQVTDTLETSFNDLGYKKLKNIEQPVRVYQVRASAEEESEQDKVGLLATWVKKRAPNACGGCLCGQTRYEAWSEPIAVGYCHCRFCQLALGAPFSAWVIYEQKFVSFVGEAPKIFRSSPIAERSFCGNCGTSLCTHVEAADKKLYYAVRLATLDNPQDFVPTCHFGVESKLPWLDINDDLPRICTSDDPEHSAKWKAVGQGPNGPKLGSAVERLNFSWDEVREE